MVVCFAVDCNHRTIRDDCSFFRFPTTKYQRAIWTLMSRRGDRSPGPDERLCSCHFKDGIKENGPTIFSYNAQKVFVFEHPEKRRKRKLSDVSSDYNSDSLCQYIDSMKCKRSDVSTDCDSEISLHQQIDSIRYEKDASTDDNSEISLYQDTAITSEGNVSTDYTSEISLCQRIDSLLMKAENEYLKTKIVELENRLQRKSQFSFSNICANNNVPLYTGLPNAEIFYVLLHYIKRFEFNYYMGWNVTNISLDDQLFIALQKLRQNHTFADLAEKYTVSVTTIRNIFFTLISILHETLFQFILGDETSIPTLRKIQLSCGNKDFQDCRFLIDCIEINVQVQRSDEDAEMQTCSSNKKDQPYKGLVAVSPQGVISFVSNLFPGAAADRYVFEKSGLVDILNPGDLIIADKSLLIHDILPKDVTLKTVGMFDATTEQATKIARVHIPVEQAIQRIKSFSILENMPHEFGPIATKIFQVCAMLVNFQAPLITKYGSTSLIR